MALQSPGDPDAGALSQLALPGASGSSHTLQQLTLGEGRAEGAMAHSASVPYDCGSLALNESSGSESTSTVLPNNCKPRTQGAEAGGLP